MSRRRPTRLETLHLVACGPVGDHWLRAIRKNLRNRRVSAPATGSGLRAPVPVAGGGGDGVSDVDGNPPPKTRTPRGLRRDRPTSLPDNAFTSTSASLAPSGMEKTTIGNRRWGSSSYTRARPRCQGCAVVEQALLTVKRLNLLASLFFREVGLVRSTVDNHRASRRIWLNLKIAETRSTSRSVLTGRKIRPATLTAAGFIWRSW